MFFKPKKKTINEQTVGPDLILKDTNHLKESNCRMVQSNKQVFPQTNPGQVRSFNKLMK